MSDDSIHFSDGSTEFDNSAMTAADDSLVTPDESLINPDDIMTMPHNSDIYFGVEIETVVKMAPELVVQANSSDHFEKFSDPQCLIFVNKLKSKLKSQLSLKEDYSQWQFTRDPSIDSGGGFNASDYASELADVWSVIESEMMTSKPEFFRCCSTHIHFSFSEQDRSGRNLDFPVHKARRIFLAAQIFEKAIDDLMPDGWQNRSYAKSLQTPSSSKKEEDEPKLVDNLCEWWAGMKGCETMPELSEQVNFDKDFAQNSRWAWADIRYFKWNCFSHRPLIYYRTIEFRQPPLSLSRRDVELWVHFVVGFVKAAVLVDEARIDAAAKTGDDDSIRALYYTAAETKDDAASSPPVPDRDALKTFIMGDKDLQKDLWDELGSIKEKVNTFFGA
ncbi:uncharacterized protein PG986_011212 [Apiospora aurea]|uniref:Uncharacterized protein n=1 Tax=Apiospora aurea TaxID=335848 RepID=A0ABR1Q4G1_9PEZI